uniref:Arrestin C-terminal-like domain-containing protein n=1 Tax=Neobodo designis TaxID=312471 RepID=A0A7S1LIE8_NEODS|mmetsp:Transcript_22920/g.71081  ORF Transcript_22920/g.71081 Transcript_22920/m.71081 type:complete len:382 (+) Transcript_22920:62-1207(+)
MGNHLTAQVRLEHEVYYPGNVVRGEATIKVDKPLKCIAARIMCRGFERAVVVNHSNEMIYNVFEDTVFYKETLTLFGHTTKDPDASPVEIPPGVYTYPFAFQLPMHLPESLHTANWTSGGAEVKYQVIAYAKLDKDLVDEGHHDFQVVVPINKRDIVASPPVDATATVKLTKFFMDKGACDFTVSLPRSIYAADDTIEGEIVIDNTNGRIAVKNPNVSLRATCESHVTERQSCVPGGIRAVSVAKPLATQHVPLSVKPGFTNNLQFKIKLPHTVPHPSYPARGCHITQVHHVIVGLEGRQVQLPIHIAHCADEENRFAYCPIEDVAHKPDFRDVEHAYTEPTGYAASPCEVLKPPASLRPQHTPTAKTPQAVGNGQLHADH